jgi:hypothetical protein
MQRHKRTFSPFELERALTKELKKVEGAVLDKSVFDAIAIYIDKKTLWLQQEDAKKAKQNEARRYEKVARLHRE